MHRLVILMIVVSTLGSLVAGCMPGSAARDEIGQDPDHSDIQHPHAGDDVQLPHVHGMGFSGDGRYLYVAVHDGLRTFAEGEWWLPEGTRHDYMGFTVTHEGFYSSGHPHMAAGMVNPLGLVKSTDWGETLERLGFEGESDFHVMDVGYYSHVVYVLNPSPNSELSVGVHYTLDEGETWQQSALQGIDAWPITLAVHPTEANVIAVGTEDGLFLSTDNGDTFHAIVTDAPVTAATFSLDADAPGTRLYFGLQALDIYDLESEQSTPLQMPQIADDDAVSYVAANPVHPDTLAIATFKRNLFLTEDGGRTWQQIAQEGAGIPAR